VAAVRIGTRDLVLTDVKPEELAEVLAVRGSNPDRLVRTEGSFGDSGMYDLSMLERDVTVALVDPAHQFSWLARSPNRELSATPMSWMSIPKTVARGLGQSRFTPMSSDRASAGSASRRLHTELAPSRLAYFARQQMLMTSAHRRS
jgi:hypothetical protein